MTITVFAGPTSSLNVDFGAGFVKLFGMRNFDIDPGETKLVESDDLDDDYEEKEYGGRIGGGKASGEAFFDPASPTQFLLNAWKNTPVKHDCKAIYSDTDETEEPFEGILTKLPRKVTRTDALMQTVEIEVVSKMTLPTS